MLGNVEIVGGSNEEIAAGGAAHPRRLRQTPTFVGRGAHQLPSPW